MMKGCWGFGAYGAIFDGFRLWHWAMKPYTLNPMAVGLDRQRRFGSCPKSFEEWYKKPFWRGSPQFGPGTTDS